MRLSIAVLSSLACFALGSLIALVIVGHAFYSRFTAVPSTAAEINRYQIVAVRGEAFRINTQTGKVWVYDEVGFDLLTVEYLQEHLDPSMTREKLAKTLEDGYGFAFPAHWKEVPELEDVEGKIELRPLPGVSSREKFREFI
jgi:hypothetical protein